MNGNMSKRWERIKAARSQPSSPPPRRTAWSPPSDQSNRLEVCSGRCCGQAGVKGTNPVLKNNKYQLCAGNKRTAAALSLGYQSLHPKWERMLEG